VCANACESLCVLGGAQLFVAFPTMEDQKACSDPVMETPPLPQTNEYRGSMFYVRPCYDEYYSQLTKLVFESEKDVSVMGTKGNIVWIFVHNFSEQKLGIGKSIFYLYSFARLRKEYTEFTIITASYALGNKAFKGGEIYHPDGQVEYVFDHSVLQSKAHEIEKVVALLDGAPMVQLECRSVCFTCFNGDWENTIADQPATHKALFMPTWTLPELEEANEVLKLNLDKKHIQKMHYLFGGIPRYCLMDYLNFPGESERIQDDLRRLVNTIFDISMFETAVSKARTSYWFQSYLLKCVPESVGLSNDYYHFELGSDFIETELFKFFESRISTDQWIGIFDQYDEASSVFSRLMEYLCFLFLNKRRFGSLLLKSLDVPASEDETIDLAAFHVQSFGRNMSYFSTQLGRPNAELIERFRFMDFWFIDHQLKVIIFFQISTSLCSPVKPERILHTVRRLFPEDPSKFLAYDSSLVFMVPDTKKNSRLSKFTKQKIEGSLPPMLPKEQARLSFKHWFEKEGAEMLEEQVHRHIIDVVGKKEDDITLGDALDNWNSYQPRYSESLKALGKPAELKLKQYVLGFPLA
jgi:hypothetical protein